MRKIAEVMPGASGAEVKVSERGTLVYVPFLISPPPNQGVCTEAGMYALRERRVHVTQEDFEMSVAKVTICTQSCSPSHSPRPPTDYAERLREEHVH